MNSDKVAIIIVNYNMQERADQIVETLQKTVKHPHDVILVDNGSDLVEKSKYTTLSLKKNVQTTHGWLMGLHYADSLETIYKEKYFAYCFVITSCKLIETKKDIISSMVNILKNDNDVVGVHPSLSIKTTTYWKKMKNDNTTNKYELSFIDNIFSCYRASWFNKIGRFNKILTYAWGIDIETGHCARQQKKKIILDCSVQVQKETDIGYTLNRMNMSSCDRKKNASNEMHLYFLHKYGPNYRQKVDMSMNIKIKYEK